MQWSRIQHDRGAGNQRAHSGAALRRIRDLFTAALYEKMADSGANRQKLYGEHMGENRLAALFAYGL